ncbi:MAG TPA: DUF5715 family protein [Bryobacteraceae bacterium]|nr:DUF5715 family protein [Bryobacteraceae bacterium]
MLGVPVTRFVAGLCGLFQVAVGCGEAPTALRATLTSQGAQNRRANADNLSRMRDVSMVKRFVRRGLLVRVPTSTRHYYLKSIPASYRYLRPWSKLFLDRLSRQYHARFQRKLRVTSLVRTVPYQRALQSRNQNAAAARGSKRSSHLTGATLDISKAAMRPAELAWMRRVLLALKKAGYLYAVEEFRQPTFHILVFRNYPSYVKAVSSR